MFSEIILECKEHSFMCTLTTEMAQFLLNTPLLYSCTTNEYYLPYIRPVMYNYEMHKCRLSFLTEKNSQEAKNLAKNPNATFTTETNHPTNPFVNSGIMIETKVIFTSDIEACTNVKESLLRKYTSHLIPEIVDYYSTENDIVVYAEITKISYWKGPKFEQFVCKGRVNKSKPKK